MIPKEEDGFCSKISENPSLVLTAFTPYEEIIFE